jgi:molecular chaperone GrpE
MANDTDKPLADDMGPSEPAVGGQVAVAGEQPDAIAALRAELEKAQSQAAEYLDGWQRARAEFANYKRRVEAERDDVRCRSNETLLLRLLPVVDDFERALQVAPAKLADTPWFNGVRMILNKLYAILESENVAPVQAVGEHFDPQWHEAMMQEETTDYPDGTVAEEVRKGYRLGDRMLRPALVKVASNASQKAAAGTDEQNAAQS